MGSRSTGLCDILMFGSNGGIWPSLSGPAGPRGPWLRFEEARRTVYICPSSCPQAWEGRWVRGWVGQWAVALPAPITTTSSTGPTHTYTHLHPCEDPHWYSLTLLLVLTRSLDPTLYPLRKAEVLGTRHHPGNPGPAVWFSPDHYKCFVVRKR